MKHTFIMLSVSFLLMQCIENESEHVVLPEVISVTSTIVSTPEFGRTRFFKIKGKYVNGQDPVKDIKIASGTDGQPKYFYIYQSVDFLDSNTFEVEFETTEIQGFDMTFYFITENHATYSGNYLFMVVGNEVRVTKP